MKRLWQNLRQAKPTKYILINLVLILVGGCLLGLISSQIYDDPWYVLSLVNCIILINYWVIVCFDFKDKLKHLISLISILFILFIALLMHNFWLYGNAPFVINLLLGTITLAFIFKNKSSSRLIKFLKYFVSILGILFSIIALLLYMTFTPATQWPRVDGPYDIGVVQTVLIDKSKKENLLNTKTPNERHTPLTIWYPAMATEKHTLFPSSGNPNNVPPSSMINRYLDKLMTNGYVEAPLATTKKSYPVVVHSPGATYYNNLKPTFFETLASHGYIVIVMGSPDANRYDQNGVLIEKSALFQTDINKLIDALMVDKKVFTNLLNTIYSIPPSKRVFSSKLKKMKSTKAFTYGALAERRVSDFNFVLNHLYQLNSDQLVKNWDSPLDLSKIACSGATFGGTATLRTDDLCNVRLAFLASTIPTIKPTYLDKPLLIFSTLTTFPPLAGMSILKAALLKKDNFLVFVKGTYELNFTDTAWKTPGLYKMLKMGCSPNNAVCNLISVGSIDPLYNIQETNKLALDFLNVYIKEEGKFSPFQHMHEFPESFIFFRQYLDKEKD